jgi:hypothetical protein
MFWKTPHICSACLLGLCVLLLQSASGQTTALPPGQHTFEDGSVIYKMPDGEIHYLLRPDSLGSRIASYYSPASDLYAVNSRDAFVVNTASSCVLDEEQLRTTLKSMSLEELLASLARERGHYTASIARKDFDMGWQGIPLHFTQGAFYVKLILSDLRLPQLIKLLQTYSPQSAAERMKAAMHEMKARHEEEFNSRLHAVAAAKDSGGSAADLFEAASEQWRALARDPARREFMDNRHAIFVMLWAMAALKLPDTETICRELCVAAIAERDKVYAYGDNLPLAHQLIDQSLYNRQLLLSALVNGSDAKSSLMAEAALNGFLTTPVNFLEETQGTAPVGFEYFAMMNDEVFERLLRLKS